MSGAGSAGRDLSSAGAQHVLVVGGGIAGLSAAWHLSRHSADVQVTVLEAADRVGGKLRAGTVAGRVTDVGAEAYLARRPEVPVLAAETGIGDALTAPATSRARLWSHGRLHDFPPGTVMGVPADLAQVSGIVSPATVPASPATPGPSRPPAVPPASWSTGSASGTPAGPGRAGSPGSVVGDVAVADYLTPHLGRDAVDRLVDPLLGGVYAGSADALSLQATLPALWDSARAGLTPQQAVAALVTGKADGTPALGGIAGGMHRLPAAVAAGLDEAGVRVRTGTTVTGLARSGGGWLVTCATGGPRQDGGGDRTAYQADAVVLAVPAGPAARLLMPTAADVAALLAGIEYASLAMVTYAFPRRRTPELAGSGLLVPAVEGLTIKAATFSSEKWAWLAAAEPRLAFVRVSIGRHGEQRTLQRPDAELVRAGLDDLALVLGRPLPEPVDARVTRWGGALPQYAVGHVDRVARIRAGLVGTPALEVCGAAYDGVGIPACVASGRVAAEAVLRRLASRPAP